MEQILSFGTQQLICYDLSLMKSIKTYYFVSNTMCLQNQEELLMCLRAYATGHHKAVIQKEVPIRWYVLESNIKEEGDKQNHGIISRSYYEEIGKKLGMNEVQIMRAIYILFKISLCFPSL